MMGEEGFRNDKLFSLTGEVYELLGMGDLFKEGDLFLDRSGKIFREIDELFEIYLTEF